MSIVNTATGPRDTSELGTTLIHEHLLLHYPGAELDSRHPFDLKTAKEEAVERAKDLRTLGVSTIVDACPIDLGRHPEFDAEVSRESGLNIIVSTGLYSEKVGQPYYFRDLSVDDLTEIFVKEITDGIGSSGIKAGMIKVACGETPLEPAFGGAGKLGIYEEKAHRAAGRASALTGVPIITHNSELEPGGLAQLEVFLHEGAKPDRIVIGHSCGVGVMRYYFDILEKGASLGFDRFGFEVFCTDKMRLASLIGLIHVGFVDQMFLSTDRPVAMLGQLDPAMLATWATLPRWQPKHIVEDIVPSLKAAGVTDQQVSQMLIGNPLRLFGG
jgi:phosphotriesterase-related protein